jgi:hypothetical protein
MKSFLVMLAVILLPLAARADQEIWPWVDLRMPIPTGGGWAPTQIHVFNDARFGTRYPGLGFLGLRVGPIWDVNKNLLVAVHGTVVAVQREPQVFLQEYRLELEPNVYGRLGVFTYNDRNRVELRWLDGVINWRYRNQLRVNYQPEGAVWIPFVWDEVIFDLSAGNLSQNRAEVGIGWQFMQYARLDLGFMLRTRRTTPSGWTNDQVLNIQLVYAPKLPSK